MRCFWLWYISIIVIVGSSFIGYNYYSDKMEQEQIYQEKQQLKEEICAQFLSNFQNKIYEGTPTYGFGRNQKIIRIKVLDKNRLEYSIGTSELFSEPKWSFHKLVQYTLDINVTEAQHQIYSRSNYFVSATLKFADYESIDFLSCELLGKLEIPSYQLNILNLRNKSDGTTFDLHENSNNMNMVKCSKCGCEMSAISEACPLCGTPTQVHNKEVVIEAQQSDCVRRSDVKVLDGLKEVLDTMIADKRIDPMSNIVATTEDGGYIDGREYFVDWIIGVPSIYTNKASIILYFWGKTDEDKKRIAKLENASIFNCEEYDCGTDTDKAAYLFSEFVRKVWMYDGEIIFESLNFEKASLDSVELYLSEDASNQWEELVSLVNDYNALAKESDYTLLSIDEKQHLFKGTFPSNKKSAASFQKVPRHTKE